MRLKRVIALGLILGMSVLAVGCGKKDTENADTTSNATSDSVTEERVVASSVAVVQILDALSVPMVGVPTSSYELPESVADVTSAGSSFMVVSENSYVGNLASIVGAKNIITDAPSSFSPIDMEYLADQNPDYILFMAHANP